MESALVCGGTCGVFHAGDESEGERRSDVPPSCRPSACSAEPHRFQRLHFVRIPIIAVGQIAPAPELRVLHFAGNHRMNAGGVDDAR